MKTILITAYAVNPYNGSEDGTGWNIAREIAKTHKVILITRKNNIPFIEKFKAESTDSVLNNMQCYGFDLSETAMKVKKKLGERGYVLYYYFWQLRIVKFIQKMGFEFDICHSLNFHSDSQPNFLWKLGKPTFWGPIGHHPRVPEQYIKSVYGFKAFAKDRLYGAVKWAFRNLDPFFKKAVQKADKIFVINSSIASAIKAKPNQVVVLPAVASETVEINRDQQEFNVLSIGRFHFMKGFDITIRAFAKFYNGLHTPDKSKVKLILVGQGEEKQRLESIAKEAGVFEQIKWVNWVSRDEVKTIYQTSSVFLFPSHEGAGMVVPEAMSYGLPVLCFDNYGPGELVGKSPLKVQYGPYQNSVDAFAMHLSDLFLNKAYRQEISNQNHKRFSEEFNWAFKGQLIKSAYSLV
ncbi:MAG: glycosyltransferase family 4 protein [Putridiphycobacter sp.]|nr:glycosyltransferase family 4 protein [Putridiphycobacter sp.]